MARFVRRIAKGPNDPNVGPRAQLAAKLSASFVSREFLDDSGLMDQIEEWMVPTLDDYSLNAIAALSPGFMHGRTGRLEASAVFAATYGIEYRFPLLDRRLIQQFLHTPSIEKSRGSIGRYLHRRAIAAHVPDSIAWQPTKDMGPPLEGELCFAHHPRLSWAELPTQLQDILDRSAVDKAQDLIESSLGQPDPIVMRARPPTMAYPAIVPLVRGIVGVDALANCLYAVTRNAANWGIMSASEKQKRPLKSRL